MAEHIALIKRGATTRMDPNWIRKLWIDFDRDQLVEDDEDEFQDNKPLLDVEELSINNHTATLTNLTELRDYILFERGRIPLKKLEISKVLFTQEKTDLIVEVLINSNCKIIELVLDSCRAKAAKMSQVFTALVQNRSVLNLTMKNMYIPLASLDQLSTVLRQNNRLSILTLHNTGLTDEAMQKLSEGLKENKNLIYLDLRGNMYENVGLQALLRSLMGNSLLHTMRLNTLQIQPENAEDFRQLFSHTSCHMKNLEMEELEVEGDGACGVIDAITGLEKLFTFDFSNNIVPKKLAQSIVAMVDKYTMMEILCLDHCDMSDQIFRFIFQNINNRELIFLNISWNQLSGDTIDEVVRVLDNNPNLQKLAMQHNRFGEVDLTQFARALSSHRSLEYIDVSANDIGNTQFNIVYEAVHSTESVLKTFHCRKNRIGGEKINKNLKARSLSLSVLDLSSNQLNEDNVLCLLAQAKENYVFVDVKVAKNVMVNASLINDIQEECRQNILIQNKIINNLAFKNDSPIKSPLGSAAYGSVYADYDTSELCLSDQRLGHFDFVLKFIRQNFNQCKKLQLLNIDLSRVQDQVKRGLEIDGQYLYRLQILKIENTEITDKPLRRLIKNLRKMKELRELHLVNQERLENFMGDLADSIKNCKHLNVLNLKQEHLRKREVVSLVPLLAQSVSIQTLDISSAVISKQNMIHLWLALHKNISILELNYSRINFFALNEIKAIDVELAINQVISQRIKPHFEAQHILNKSRKELSLSGFPVQREVIPAILKYLKMQTQMTSLDLSGTGLTRYDLGQFLSEIVKREVKLTKLNLSDNTGVNDFVAQDLCLLFSHHSTMEELYLDKTQITQAGLLQLLESISQSLKVKTISVEHCAMNLTRKKGQDIIGCLEKNISLTKLSYVGNKLDIKFRQGVQKELKLNQQVVTQILPQLIDQELTAQAKARQQKKDQRFLRRTRKKSKLESNNRRLSKLKRQNSEKIEVPEQNDNNKRSKTVPKVSVTKDQLIPEFQALAKPDENQIIDSSSQLLEPRRGMSDNLKQLVPQFGRPKSKQDSRRGSFNLTGARSDGKVSEEAISSASDQEDDLKSQSYQGSDASSDGPGQTLMKQLGGFNLDMKDYKIEDGIGFITKFTRVFQKIKTIDFGGNKIKLLDAVAINEEMKLNKYIQNVIVKKKNMGTYQYKILEQEIKKNIQIASVSGEGFDMNYEATVLDLAKHNLTDLSFLPKMISDFTKLEVLDLSNSDMRSKESVRQLCIMIDQNDTIKSLKVRNCKISANTLSILAGALTKKHNENLVTLDIRDNPIQDEQYKVLFGLLQNNLTLLNLHYTLYSHENIDKLAEYQKLTAEGLDKITISIRMSEHSHHHGIPLWQKICFPIWMWKTLIHDKHEAFRFKYDTVAITRIEQHLMPQIKRHLYYWSVVYYLIVLVLPYVAIRHDCGQTYDPWLYYLYGAYLILSAIWEVLTVLEIQRIAANRQLLKFNSWHFVELIMGSIARTDTFLDILFLHLIMNCWGEFVPYCVSSLTFAAINLTFPLFMLLKLLRTDKTDSLVQPFMESACFVSFIRETMLLATVLDSFCINNSFYFGNKPLVFGKLMGFFSFLTQDFPQLSIHVIFKLVIISDSQKKLKKQTLLIVGMVCSCFAILVSLFNMIMCAQNEFDPIILEDELKKRKSAAIAKRAESDDDAKVKQKKKDLLKAGVMKALLNAAKRSNVVIKGINENGEVVKEKEIEKKLSLMDRLRSKNKAEKDKIGGEALSEMAKYSAYHASAIKADVVKVEIDAMQTPIMQNTGFAQLNSCDDTANIASDRRLLKSKDDSESLLPRGVVLQDYQTGDYASSKKHNLISQLHDVTTPKSGFMDNCSNSSSKKQGLIKQLRDKSSPSGMKNRTNKIKPTEAADNGCGMAHFSNASDQHYEQEPQRQEESFESFEEAVNNYNGEDLVESRIELEKQALKPSRNSFRDRGSEVTNLGEPSQRPSLPQSRLDFNANPSQPIMNIIDEHNDQQLVSMMSSIESNAAKTID